MIKSGNLPKEATSLHLVRFQDCDPFGHLNNSRYLDYFMNAREDQLKDTYGFDIIDFQKKTGLAWVVVQSQVSYLRPVHPMETVAISSRVISYSDKTVTAELQMHDKTKTKLKAVLWTKFVQISVTNGKSAEQPGELLQFFGQVLFTEDAPITDNFEKRVQQIKAQYS